MKLQFRKKANLQRRNQKKFTPHHLKSHKYRLKILVITLKNLPNKLKYLMLLHLKSKV